MKLFGFLMLPLLLGAPPAQTVSVHVKWESKGVPVPMKIYEYAYENEPHVWRTEVVPSIQQAPIKSEIADSTLHLARGKPKLFALVLENNTDNPIYFFAAPHHVLPDDSALGFHFDCLCLNHAFQVPPHQVWYRVVRMQLAKEFVGDSIDIVHTLVAIDEKRMKNFKAPSHERIF